MKCNCQRPEAQDAGAPADVTRKLVMPCDPDTLARLQAEYFPRPPRQDPPEIAAAATARQLCRDGHIKLSREAELLLDDELTPKAYFERLLASDHLADARRILAHALPKRRALWWACLCAHDAYQGETPANVAQAVDVVVKFVRSPSEENRREAERIGRSFPASRLEGCLTMAAFFSGGSISLPHLPAVAPRPFVTGRLAAVSVYLAAVIRSSAEYKHHLRQYLSIGAGIARGENLWNARRTAPTRIDPGSTLPLRGMHLRRDAAHRPHRKPEIARDAER